MEFFAATSRTEFQQQLQEALHEQVDDRAGQGLAGFAARLHALVPLEELRQRRRADLLGSTLSAWRLLQRFDPVEPQVRVYNPDYERDGWQSVHSVVEVLHPDMPFLVDSVRIELKRRGHAIHALRSSVLALRRDAAGNLLEVLDGVAADSVREALIHLEIDRCAAGAGLLALERALREVLAEVRLVDADAVAMRSRLRAHRERLEQQANEPAQVEIVSFLDWLLDGHFTFLGYEEFQLQEEAGGALIGYRPESLLGLSRRLRANLDDAERRIDPAAQAYLAEPLPLSFAKAGEPSRVHRPAYPDFVSLRELDEQGRVRCEYRFMGLYSPRVYADSVRSIPVIRRKVGEVVRRAGFDPEGHLARELAQILEVLPRDDLFQTPLEELQQTVLSILQIQERSLLRLFLRTDPYGRFVYCLAYVPRDLYSTETRQTLQAILMQRLGARDCEFWVYFSESVLARVQFILRVEPGAPLQIDAASLEREAVQALRSWDDDYRGLVVEQFGEARGLQLLGEFPQGFPAGYRERFAAQSAVVDMQHLGSLDDGNRLVMSFYQPLSQEQRRLHCKLYQADTPLALSDVLPILENLGLRVLGEFPYRLQRADGREYWIHDFAFTHAEGLELDLRQLNETLQEAFVRIVEGRAENDAFNRLVLTASMHWRDVALLRAYARYLKQIRLGFDLAYIASALLNHVEIARELVRLFRTRFYLARKLSAEDLADKQQRLEQAILAALEQVEVLNEDRILRRYLDLVRATLRSNFYQNDGQGRPRDYFSFKLDPRQIPEMPRPVPRYEIFVYSPRVEGVHLRGGKVARGGLRWSDREEDYRTEVLGLVKAQQVKNAVIVPVGAKGGFVPRRLPSGAGREEIQAEAIACYRIFISALLDITDNLRDGVLLPPEGVVRHDEDDPYLVVAADKGTASFSDIANGIAADYGFWLGDAFASGGSAGYDHKRMGITARGGWVSVQRHFRERGIDVQNDRISVVGIGDMAGDVFGNAMLLSQSLQLVGAFNHQHIFIDPEPDPARSFAERRRLFELPRSSWRDYDPALISDGGGVFERSAKRIAISPQMRERFAIDAEQLTPTELIGALLRAPVDLLWNGGIGTYVKASSESHADVGDKANDALRVNGCELRARVVGEGGNLGMTQLGRVEYALAGGAGNTDFIDNAGGVDCSDHEVNIKILLGEVLQDGDLTLKQRNELLAEMTDSVAEHVLENNYRQAQALSIAQRRARERQGEYRRLIAALEAGGSLDRALEFLPGEEALAERAADGQGLTRPELAVLMAYSKIELKVALLRSALPDDDYLTTQMESAFPAELVRRYPEGMRRHRLRREIIANQLANDLVNHMGITFVQRLKESTGLGEAAIAHAYVVVRDLFGLHHWWRRIEALDLQLPAELQLSLMDELMRLARRATRWFLRNRRGEGLDAARAVEHFAQPLASLGAELEDLLEGPPREQWLARHQAHVEAGVPADLARMVAGASHLYTLLAVIDAADATARPPAGVATAYFAVGAALELNWYHQQISALAVESHWQALAREAYRDDLEWQQRSITVSILRDDAGGDIEACLARWLARQASLVERWRLMLSELRSATGSDYAMYAVANRELLDLAQSTALAEGGG